MNNYHFKIFNNYISWSRVKYGKPINKNHSPYQAKPLDVRVKRVFNCIKKLLLKIVNQPLWFVTLSMPKKVYFRELANETPIKTKELLRQLKRKFCDDFPLGYLFWDIEYSYKGGVHLHLGCYPGEEIDREDIESWFRNTWCRICDDYRIDLVDVQVFDHNTKRCTHATYLTKKGKEADKKNLIEKFGINKTFGIIGRQNCVFEKPRVCMFTEDQKREVIDTVIKHSRVKIQKMKKTNKYEKKELENKIQKELDQIEQVKCGYGLHYLDERLRKKLMRIIDRK